MHTYATAAEHYSKSSRTIRKHVAEGNLQAYRDGKSVLIRCCDLLEFFTQQPWEPKSA